MEMSVYFLVKSTPIKYLMDIWIVLFHNSLCLLVTASIMSIGECRYINNAIKIIPYDI